MLTPATYEHIGVYLKDELIARNISKKNFKKRIIKLTGYYSNLWKKMFDGEQDVIQNYDCMKIMLDLFIISINVYHETYHNIHKTYMSAIKSGNYTLEKDNSLRKITK